MAFIAYRILTPPQNNQILNAPDGTHQARLKTFYYTQNIPSYKIYTRPTGTLLWKNQLYLPSYTTTPNPTASLQWTPDSQRLDLLINQSSIWHHITLPSDSH